MSTRGKGLSQLVSKGLSTKSKSQLPLKPSRALSFQKGKVGKLGTFELWLPIKDWNENPLPPLGDASQMCLRP
jgi:hypothetical protein